jgi:hypothetical protein
MDNESINFLDQNAVFKITGEQISIIFYLTRQQGGSKENGEKIRDILRGVANMPREKKKGQTPIITGS